MTNEQQIAAEEILAANEEREAQELLASAQLRRDFVAKEKSQGNAVAGKCYRLYDPTGPAFYLQLDSQKHICITGEGVSVHIGLFMDHLKEISIAEFRSHAVPIARKLYEQVSGEKILTDTDAAKMLRDALDGATPDESVPPEFREQLASIHGRVMELRGNVERMQAEMIDPVSEAALRLADAVDNGVPRDEMASLSAYRAAKSASQSPETATSVPEKSPPSPDSWQGMERAAQGKVEMMLLSATAQASQTQSVVAPTSAPEPAKDAGESQPLTLPTGYTMPDGWRMVAFRPPMSREKHLLFNGGEVLTAMGDYPIGAPRPIVVPIAPPDPTLSEAEMANIRKGNTPLENWPETGNPWGPTNDEADSSGTPKVRPLPKAPEGLEQSEIEFLIIILNDRMVEAYREIDAGHPSSAFREKLIKKLFAMRKLPPSPAPAIHTDSGGKVDPAPPGSVPAPAKLSTPEEFATPAVNSVWPRTVTQPAWASFCADLIHQRDSAIAAMLDAAGYQTAGSLVRGTPCKRRIAARSRRNGQSSGHF